MGRRLLILLLEGASREDLEAAVEARGDGYPSVHIVAPANVSALDWLATDETSGAGEAGARALEAEWLLDGEVEIAGAEAGHLDPVQAVADARERFEPDEIVVVGPRTTTCSTRSAGSALPSPRRPVLRRRPRRSRLRTSAQAFMSGRNECDAVGRVRVSNLGFLLIAIAFALIATLIVWLATWLRRGPQGFARR